jgi:hypothetical protein
MEEFTLYQTLSKNLKTMTMTAKQMTELLKKFKTVNHMAVARLILEHYRKSSKEIDVKDPKLPYGGVQTGEDATFDLKKLPNDLRWILWKFANLN